MNNRNIVGFSLSYRIEHLGPLTELCNIVIGTRCSEWFFLINTARYFSTWRKFRSLADDIPWSESLVFLIIGLFHAIFLQFNFDYLWKESHQKIKEELTGLSNCFGTWRYKIIKPNSKLFYKDLFNWFSSDFAIRFIDLFLDE